MPLRNFSSRTMLQAAFLFTLLITAFISGCGKGDRPDLCFVHGRVTLDGKPLDNAAVSFKPDGPFRESSATTDADGNYELTYIRNDKGAAVGKHKVYFSTANPFHKYVEKLPASPNKQTTLEKEIQSGDNEINFDLKSK